MAQSTDKRKIKIEKQLTPAQQAEANRAAEVRRSADRIARQIIDMTRNSLFVTLRFMDVALCQFTYINSDQLAENIRRVQTVATTGQHMIYDPQYIIEQYMKDKQSLPRDYLHMVLHCVFRHPFVSAKLDKGCWDLACDIAAEAIICELDIRQANIRNSADVVSEIQRIRGMLGQQLTAERLYAWFRAGGAQHKDMEKWRRLFCRDDHAVWWDIAEQIEEEMKRRAEEEDDERAAEKDDQESSREDQEDSGDDSEDESGSDKNAEDQETDEDSGDDAGDGSGDEEGGEDSEDFEETVGEEEKESPEEGEEAAEEESEEAEENSEENEGFDEEESEEESEAEYEDEYSSVPGESLQSENPDDMADPDSDTHDTGEESNPDGSGGGGTGDDPQQSDDEGSGQGESPDGMQGESGGESEQDDVKRPDSNMNGTAGEGRTDDSQEDNPFDDNSTGGNSADMSGSGGRQQQGTSGGEHQAGSGGGGDGSQSAWEHSSGAATERGSGDDGERSRLSGSAGNGEELQSSAEQQKQEAKAEQGTADNGEEDKAPSYMHSGEEQRELEEKWKEISERMLVDLETSSKEWGDKSDAMLQGIKKINRDKYDYETFLKKFATMREDIQINDDEFDYVYYTLGMERYGNIPLIEPLEYKEVRKVRDFVIAIDTSGSCAGEVVQKFLDKTFSIFMQQENFFRKINLHIIQCDAEIQEVARITDKTEFEDYIRNLEFKGFGGTDFRPVFAYVDRMIEEKEFDDLKGLIYFTDGNGTYPKRRPAYETAFIFVDDDEFEYQVPSWAMKLVLETGDITEEVLI